MVARAKKIENKRIARAAAASVKLKARTPPELRRLLPAMSSSISARKVIDENLSRGLTVKNIPHLFGVGVFASKTFLMGEVIVRYAGETISLLEGAARHEARECGKALFTASSRCVTRAQQGLGALCSSARALPSIPATDIILATR
ncbi:MAG: hypothetical protein JW384_01661 [Nitrosomonadaceae bacterium]|nr:hypothetical protein [Nitrosomonadaceae bacterium]